MCGILFTTNPQIKREDFLSALALLKHRGPDVGLCYGEHSDLKLGHTRLSILDLDARSNQPFYSADGRYVIIFNGEIYNFRELSKDKHLETRTTSDTEVLLQLYLSYGEQCLEWLVGMFAFVIADTSTGDYFIARDRLGVKPLYLYEDRSGLVVSSEMAALLHLIGPRDIDEFSVRQYRTMRGFFNGRTLYKGVSMFPAGSLRKNLSTRKYWQLPVEEKAPPSDDDLRSLIQSAVESHCIADVPVGSYLSGGLDSSILSALANLTHTWVVGLDVDNEFHWARLVAERIGSKHHEVVVDCERFLESARLMIRKRHEPIAVPNEVLLYEMSREVKKENTVVLSGEGADELFAGYDRIFRWAADSPWDLQEFAKRYCYGSQLDLEVVEDAVAPFEHLRSSWSITSAFFQISHLHGLLRRLDSSTMLASVEGRVPFVDHRLVEMMAGVSSEYKLQDGKVKEPLKRLFGHLLPPEVVSRDKVGFPVKLEQILPANVPGSNQMDRWFNFNLSEIGLVGVA